MIKAMVFLSGVVVAAICLECIRDRDYEDEVLGRFSLWILFMVCVGRCSQIAGAWLEPFLGSAWLARNLQIDNVEFLLWMGIFVFFTRHFYRFRMWRKTGKYAWRDSTKAQG